MQTTEFIWFDGKLVPWNEAQVHVLTHALHYGSAVFEGIRAYKCADGTSAVFRLQEHAQRLINSGKILRLEIPYTAEQIADGIIETLKATNEMLISTLDEVVRIQDEGRQKRRQAEAEMLKIEQDLKNKLIAASTRSLGGQQ